MYQRTDLLNSATISLHFIFTCSSFAVSHGCRTILYLCNSFLDHLKKMLYIYILFVHFRLCFFTMFDLVVCDSGLWGSLSHRRAMAKYASILINLSEFVKIMMNSFKS